jgi:hypothetical protein
MQVLEGKFTHASFKPILRLVCTDGFRNVSQVSGPIYFVFRLVETKGLPLGSAASAR